MGEKKPEPLDFVKDFQEYLTQQTHHVNMISGSVSGDKEAETLQGGRLTLILRKSSVINVLMFMHSSPFNEYHYPLVLSNLFFSRKIQSIFSLLLTCGLLLWDNELM